MSNKQAIINEWKMKLGSDSTWACRGLIRIFEKQTDDEKQAGMTNRDNGVGFTGMDAEILTSFAAQYQRWGRLSDKQMVIVFKKMPKYAGQLYRIVHG